MFGLFTGWGYIAGMEFIEYMLIKLGILAVLAFIYGLLIGLANRP